MENKLTIEQKVEIALTRGMSLRELAKKYGVHHSCIAVIQKESEELILRYWREKADQVGRPANKVLPEQVEIDNLQKKNKELVHNLALKEMKIDWLKLKLKWDDELFAEAKIKKSKQLKKKQKIEVVELAGKHENKYPDVDKIERLACLDTTPKDFKYLCSHLRERLRRESAIPEEDIEEAIKQIIELPFLGGRKGALKLVEENKAMVGETLYKEIKQQLLELSEKKLARIKSESELEVNQYKRKRNKEDAFEKIQTTECHEVWAIDFTYLTLFGIRFFACVVYELHAQGYLSIVPCDSPSKEIAMQAVEEAVRFAGTTPKRCLLSDCGGQFLSFAYKKLLKYLKIKDLQTPPGQPWYNGALESGNRDLKHVILTIAFYEACCRPDISKVGVSRKKVLDFLRFCCLKAQKMINEQIPRVKFGTTPMAVLKNEVANRKRQRDLFAQKKAEERKQRMKKIKEGEITCKHKTFGHKVRAVWGKLSKVMTTEKLFAFTELLNKRYQAITT